VLVAADYLYPGHFPLVERLARMSHRAVAERYKALR